MRVRELSPAGRGAVSVVVVEGHGALDVVARVFRVPPPTGEGITLARLQVAGAELDEALLVVLDEEWVELHLHGNPLIVGQVMQALHDGRAATDVPHPSNAGAGRERLAGALSEDGARILLDQAEGALGRELDRLLALETEGELRAGVRTLLERTRVAEFVLRPRCVVIAGPVNAGKSTLFNVLTGSERVVAAAQEGTTRDAIREPAVLGCYPIELVDTAGTRPLADGDEASRLERLAQSRAREWRARADLVLLLEPAGAKRSSTEGADAPGPRDLRLTSRVDALPAAERPAAGISALHHPAGAREQVEQSFREVFGLPVRAWEPGRGVLLAEGSRSQLAHSLSEPGVALRERLLAIRSEEVLAVAVSRAPS